MTKWALDIALLEQGDIYFFYKPRTGVETPSGLTDVGRFYIVLQPESKHPPRYIVFGNKKLPHINGQSSAVWGFIQMVGGRGFEVDNPVKRPTPTASRPVGEGIYAIVGHRDHTHLLYSLELPKRIGEVQKAFNINKEGNYIFMERSIQANPKNIDIPYSNFSPVTQPNLNQKGTEILLVGVGKDVGRLGIRAINEQETFQSADIFSKLKVDASRHPSRALISGKWE